MMDNLSLNNPDTRQGLLRKKLATDRQLVATDLAREFGISLDTIRRDLLALEEKGIARRVRGGAVPMRGPEMTYSERRCRPSTDCSAIVPAALPLVKEGMTLILDGGTTNTHFAQLLDPLPRLFIITPSPAIAAILLEKGIQTHLIGGRLSPWGGIAVGGEAERAIANLSADMAFIGICALDAEFGLSANDADEAGVMRAMTQAARDTSLILAKDKLGKRAPHKVLPSSEISFIVTDADAQEMQPFAIQGTEVSYV